jgi:hypothetical protein
VPLSFLLAKLAGRHLFKSRQTAFTKIVTSPHRGEWACNLLCGNALQFLSRPAITKAVKVAVAPKTVRERENIDFKMLSSKDLQRVAIFLSGYWHEPCLRSGRK